MADVTKTVLLELQAATEQYVQAMNKAAAATGDVTEESKDLQDQSTKTSRTMDTNIGKTLGGITKLVPGLEGVSKGFEKTGKAATAFGNTTKAALIATGVGVFIVLLGSLVAKFLEMKEKGEENLGFLETQFYKLGKSIESALNIEALGGWGDAIIRWVGKANPALVSLTETYLAQKKVFDDTRAAQKAAADATLASIAADERLLAVSKAAKDDREAVYELEVKVLEAKIANAKTTEEAFALETQLQVLRTTKQTQDRDEITALNEKAAARELANTQLSIEIEETTRRIEQERELLELQQFRAEQDQANQKAANDILIDTVQINEDLAEQVSAEDQAEQDRVRTQVEGMMLTNKIITESALFTKAVQLKTAISDAYKSIVAIWAQSGVRFPVKLAQSVAVAAITARNIAKMQSITFAAGGEVPGRRGGMIRGPRHAHGGVKFGVGGMYEAEGGEFIVNRKATKAFYPIINAINDAGKRFEDGGIVAPTIQAEQARLTGELAAAASSSRAVLVLEDFRRASDRLDVVENLSRIS